jgi:hypothetical protein
VWRNAEVALARPTAAGGGRVELFGAEDGGSAADPGAAAEAAAAPQPGAA